MERAGPNLDYDGEKFPMLSWGYNDLNGDGVADTLVTVWNGKTAVFVGDDGTLPWSAEDEDRDWNAYFNEAFNAGQDPPLMWNDLRRNWGNYTILVDRDDCGRFDTYLDFYYKAIDLNGDGAPEAEYFHFTLDEPNRQWSWSNKLHVSLNGDRNMAYLDWGTFSYANEMQSREDGSYVNNVQGSGFFLNSYSSNTQNAWENPIAWYDFDFDGHTNMVMRAADTHYVPEADGNCPYRGDLGEFEIAFELNGNARPGKFHSLDMQLTFYQYEGEGPSYQRYVDRIPLIAGLPEAAFLSGKRLATRQEMIRRCIPYMDGFKIASEFEGWKGVFLLFDEDDDDCRWEEMFARYEKTWGKYSDKIGDRFEHDVDYAGKGKLYVGRFDGRIHLYHAEMALWDIDYLALYKGSCDREDTADGPAPPAGLRYPRVRYSDTTGNGFIDRIEYLTVEYGREEETETIDRTVSLLEFADADDPSPDVCELIDPRGRMPASGWRIETWDGSPLRPEDFDRTPNKEVYDKMIALYDEVCRQMWAGAWKLYQAARRHRLNVSEDRDRDLKRTYTHAELARRTDVLVPQGYSQHLSGQTRRDRYHNGFWLREKVFADVVAHSGLERFTLEKYYYTGRIDRLCEYLDENLTG